jgi:hypothetical protein
VSPIATVRIAGLLPFLALGSSGAGDNPRAPVQHNPRVAIAYPESSPPLLLIRPPDHPQELVEHEVRRKLRAVPLQPALPDPVIQSNLPIREMPTTILNFLAQGNASTSSTVTGEPPDTNGAVGPNHFVQTVNGGLEIWTKSGTVAATSILLNGLWSGYTGTNPGNSCATQNDGDPVVVYDGVADRWFITQFSLPNSTTTGGPSFQCVAVSKTPDPTGAYWLYDFQYTAEVNDYGKFGIWPDAYYATFNLFDANFLAADLCAYDRNKMLQGQPATQQCFQDANGYGVLPVNLDGKILPPQGEPGFFVGIDQGTAPAIDLWKLHVDWTTPANSALTGPTTVAGVSSFAQPCNSTTCTTIAGGGTTLDSLGDRVMFHLAYRNFGTHESLTVNHTVTAGSTTGVRWYEIHDPAGTPTVFQQGTYAPSDSKYRWMASIAEDMAQDFALGFSVASSTVKPDIAWTGRLNSDAVGTMGQGETTLQTGKATESGAARWGDYSNMTIDPVDDCTFWYTQELYNTSGGPTWDTYIANSKFPNCGANDFTLGVSPASQKVAPGGQVTYAIATTQKAGAAETIALNIQDLPTGVTGSFSPATVSTGASSTLTLTAAAGAAITPATAFTVIGTATSAVHPAGGQVGIAAVPSVSISAPTNGATVSQTLTVNATATPASGGTLATLALTIDGASVQSGATSPLTYSWDTTKTSNGTHTLIATATDGDGTTASQAVTVTVKNNPTVVITSPTGGTVSGVVPVTATAAVPNGATLNALVITIDGTQVQTGATSPLTYNWDTTALAGGSSHTIAVTATDADGGTANASITVTVSNTPTSVNITAPANNATVSGRTPVTVAATVGTGVTVTNLLLAIDGKQVQTGASATLNYTWDTTQVANGTHSLAANVTDSTGTSATSTAVIVNVANGSGSGGDGGSTGGGDGGSGHGGGGSNGGCGCGAGAGAPAIGLLSSLLAWAGARRRRRR